MSKNRTENPNIASDRIDILEKDEIFVFGSNLTGHHMGGAARAAHKKFGAEWGVGVGLTGQSCFRHFFLLVFFLADYQQISVLNFGNLGNAA